MIVVPLPDAKALQGVLRFHLKDDLVGTDLSIVVDRLEARGQTGADVEKAVHDARRRVRLASRSMWLDDLRAETEVPRVGFCRLSVERRYVCSRLGSSEAMGPCRARTE